MAADPFSAREINDSIAEEVARIHSVWLERCAKQNFPAGYEETIIETFLKTLDAHGEGYLKAVLDSESLKVFCLTLRWVGSTILGLAQKQGPLSNLFPDERFRKLVLSSWPIIKKMIENSKVPVEQQERAIEAHIEAEVDRLRQSTMQQASDHDTWRVSVLRTAEILFEARYKHWYAEALKKLRLQKTDSDASPKASHLPKTETEQSHPLRAKWLQERLKERAWNRNDPHRHGGPDAKTIDKILDGKSVREDVLEKLAKALSNKNRAVNILDIPTA